MRGISGVLIGIAGVLVASSCRTATRVIEEPRVDLEMSGSGNRGYLLGTPPPVSEPRRTTRQMVETEVEVPAFGRPVRAGRTRPVGLGEVAPPELDWSEEAPASEEGWPQTFETYVVKKGDTLWSIAADPNVFGDATKWRKLYAANRDVLKSPDQLRPGMTLRVPRGGASSSQEPAQETPGVTTYTK